MSSDLSSYPHDDDDSKTTLSSSSAPSFDVEYCPTCPTARKELDWAAQEALARQYGGETSPLDGSPFAEPTFVIPDVPERFFRIVSEPSALQFTKPQRWCN